MADIPKPISDEDKLLHNIIDGTPDITDMVPTSREEEYLKYIAVNGISGDSGVGKDLSSKEVEPTLGNKVTAGNGAEIFNDYRDRTFDNYGSVTTGNIASGEYSHAEGEITTASGNRSHAEGLRTTASGIWSHVEGSSNIASGRAAHAEGEITKASGYYSHTEGERTISSATASHAEGSATTSSEYASHAEGSYTTASGYASHSEGKQCEAKGNSSHAGGYNTIANDYQCVIGLWNTESNGPISDSSSTGDIFIIGGGTSATSRKNALRTTKEGKTYGLQSFQSSGADYAEYFEWEDGNPYNEDRRGLFVTVNGKKILKANFGDFIIGVISSTPTVVGDTASEIWDKMYLKDVFGDYITEEAYTEEEKDEQGNIKPSVKYTRWLLNPEYDSSLKYKNRESRNEWGCVGLFGKLVVIDDGTCEVNGFCTATYNGKATISESGYRVLERIDNNHIKILLK